MRNLALLFICSPLLMLSQEKIDAEKFFALGLSAYTTTENDTPEEVRFPWLEAYEIRTETRDFEFPKQEYTLRVKPSSPGKRKALKALYEHMRNAPDFGARKAYCDLLLSLHTDWLSLYIIHENLTILEALADVIRDKQIIYEKAAGAYDIDLEKVIRLQTDKSDLMIAVNELQLEQERIRNKYGIQDDELDFLDFITIESIANTLKREHINEKTTPDTKAAYEKELIAKELAVEKAKDGKILDFVQFRYQGPHSNILRERLSVGVGLQIPNFSNRKIKIKELELKQKEVEKDVEEDQQERYTLKQKLMTDIKAYTFYKHTVNEERTQLKRLGDQIVKQEDFNPFLLLDIEERYLDNRFKALRKKEDILYDYLKYLDTSGNMCPQSLVNYLAAVK